MISNLNKFIYSIKKRGINNKGSIYAQIIKGERIKKNKTLEEVAKGICSVSYLCKLENYAITPPLSFVKTLFEKMNLNYESVNDEDFEFSLNKGLCYFYENSDKLDEMVQRLSVYDASPTIKILKCLYNLKIFNYDELIEEIHYLDEIKDTLGGLESLAFIYVVLKYYVDNSYFARAYDYLKCLDFIDVENKYLKYLLLEANLLTSFHMKNYYRFSNSYLQLDSLLYTNYNFYKKMQANMMYNIFRFDEYNNLLFNDTSETENKEIAYYKFIIELKCEKFNQVFNEIYLNFHIYDDYRFLGLLGYIIYKTKNDELINKVISLIDQHLVNEKNKIHYDFVNLMIMVCSGVSRDDVRDFLKREYVPKVNKVYNYLYDDVYKEIYLDILGNNSHYKEAFLFLIEFYKIKYEKWID